ncbi:hypothetical protein J0910_06895 [Nocardiopsis sp. CNT-189]|uniref:hypothetical protein n=1 Tax=Nocardiopsis oceanisediminis TaxID=2816862 RepID=UPI003B2EA21B
MHAAEDRDTQTAEERAAAELDAAAQKAADGLAPLSPERRERLALLLAVRPPGKE